MLCAQRQKTNWFQISAQNIFQKDDREAWRAALWFTKQQTQTLNQVISLLTLHSLTDRCQGRANTKIKSVCFRLHPRPRVSLGPGISAVYGRS